MLANGRVTESADSTDSHQISKDEIAQIIAGTRRGGYDRDRINAALSKLSS